MADEMSSKYLQNDNSQSGSHQPFLRVAGGWVARLATSITPAPAGVSGPGKHKICTDNTSFIIAEMLLHYAQQLSS